MCVFSELPAVPADCGCECAHAAQDGGGHRLEPPHHQGVPGIQGNRDLIEKFINKIVQRDFLLKLVLLKLMR